MSYTNVYPSRINWENEPSIASPINATNLNKLDYAAYEFDQTFATWDITKANQSDLLLSVKEINYDDETGVFVFTWQNGTTKTVDLNIEKIPVSFSMSPQGVITMTTDDGTTYTADVGSLIKTYTFTDSSVIDFTVTTDASGNKTVTADIVDGSITGTKLQPNYLADCQSAKTAAENAEDGAEDSAEDAEAWAVGERGGVPVPSTDPAYNNNSKYWAQHTSASLAGLTDTDITSPTNGQVLTYDGSKWINDDPSAGGGSKVVVSTAEASLIGTTCTLSQGGDSYTATFSNSGVATFEGVTLTGTVTITATDGQSTATRTLEIPYFGNYTQTVSFFSATITATFPADKGATCTCDGVTASTSPYTFTVGAAGTYSVVCTLDGQPKSVSVPITTDGQTESVNFAFGTINLTYDNAFRGLTVTCSSSGTTISKTAPISGNTMAFYPPSTGEWIISSTYSGTPYQVTATITSLSIAVSAQLQMIPDGDTVTPTDDIQKWLNCAGIFDKVSYTALSDILSDSITFNALLGDSNACKYMARSTTWASTLCADQYAMTMIGQYNVCCDALLGNATWASAIGSSSYADYVFSGRGLVPVMTSNTTPSGEASASTYYSTGYEAYKAFDGVDTNGWLPATADTANNARVIYNFTSAQKIKGARIVQNGTSGSSYNYGVTIQGSNDNNTWVDISSETVIATVNTPYYVICDDSISYPYVCMTITTSYSGGINAGNGWNVQFYCKSSGEKIHGTNNEIAYYLDAATQVPISDPSTLDTGTYTFGSTIAKNPDSLSSDYTKQIRITPNTVEVVLRPDNSLYWWGYRSGNLEELSSGNGWSGVTYTSPTYNTNNISISSSSSNAVGVGTRATISGTNAHVIGESTAMAYSEGLLYRTTSSKDITSSIIAKEQTVANTIQKLDISLSSSYFACYVSTGRAGNIYALWYE
jgi:hypothetical protein